MSQVQLHANLARFHCAELFAQRPHHQVQTEEKGNRLEQHRVRGFGGHAEALSSLRIEETLAVGRERDARDTKPAEVAAGGGVVCCSKPVIARVSQTSAPAKGATAAAGRQ